MYNKKAKEEILRLTEAAIILATSANRYATKTGISASHISNLRAKKWDLISEDMWRKIANACGYKEGSWQYAETANGQLLTKYLQLAKDNSEVYAYVNPAGSSKTGTVKEFALNNPYVAHLQCEEHWNKKHFLLKLYTEFCGKGSNYNTSEILDHIEKAIVERTEKPLIVLDEIDKLRDDILYFFISLYNRLEDKCGIVLVSTDYLEKRVQNGIKHGKKGFEEFYSRLGGNFIKGIPVSSTDVVAVCRANGIEDEKVLEGIIKECKMDLRRVKRLVTAKQRKGKVKPTVTVKTEEAVA